MIFKNFKIMSKPIFFHYNNKFYNVYQIVNFETIGTEHHIAFSNGDIVKVNKGNVNFEKVIAVINPPYGEGYSSN